VRLIVIPADGVIGVRDRDDGPEFPADFSAGVGACPSPSLTRVSIDFSTFPPCPFKMVRFLFSSRNPISRN
jgi:hypothetical protein